MPEPPSVLAVRAPTSSFDDTAEFGDDELAFDDDCDGVDVGVDDGGLGDVTLDVDADDPTFDADDNGGAYQFDGVGISTDRGRRVPFDPSDDEDERGRLIVDENYSLPLSEVSVEKCTPCCDRVGRQVLICGPRDYQRKRFPSICLVGPDWPCLMYTYGLITVPSLLWLAKVAWNVHSIVFVLGCLSYTTLICSLSCAACSDPGVIPKQLPMPDEEVGQNSEEDSARRVGPLCVHCNIYRPEGTIHCYDCNCCVLEVSNKRDKGCCVVPCRGGPWWGGVAGCGGLWWDETC